MWLLPIALIFSVQTASDAERASRAVESSRDAVVHLTNLVDGEDRGNGTGFVVDPRGVIATNSHVLQLAGNHFIARFRDGTEREVLGLLVDDPEHDLALIRVDPQNLPKPVRLANNVEVGQAVALVGSPFGLEQTLGVGIVSAIRPDGLTDRLNKDAERAGRVVLRGPIVQHTISTSFGSSGSPIFNMSGDLVAVNHSIISGSEINFAAHVSVLKALLDKTDLDAAPTKLGRDRRWNLAISALIAVGLLMLFLSMSIIRRSHMKRPMPRHYETDERSV